MSRDQATAETGTDQTAPGAGLVNRLAPQERQRADAQVAGGDGGATGGSCAETAAEKVARELHDLEFAIHVSMRYHSRRRAWFDMLHRTSLALAAIGGSGALASLLAASQPGGGVNLWATWISFAVTVIGASSLAFGFADRARLANDLYRRFTILAHKIATQAGPGEAEVRAWTGERLLIEADEPSTISALVKLCQNAEAQSRGCEHDENYPIPVGWWQRLFANLCDLPLTDWRAVA